MLPEASISDGSFAAEIVDVIWSGLLTAGLLDNLEDESVCFLDGAVK